jgi:hypothetical protein
MAESKEKEESMKKPKPKAGRITDAKRLNWVFTNCDWLDCYPEIPSVQVSHYQGRKYQSRTIRRAIDEAMRAERARKP